MGKKGGVYRGAGNGLLGTEGVQQQRGSVEGGEVFVLISSFFFNKIIIEKSITISIGG